MHHISCNFLYQSKQNTNWTEGNLRHGTVNHRITGESYPLGPKNQLPPKEREETKEEWGRLTDKQ